MAGPVPTSNYPELISSILNIVSLVLSVTSLLLAYFSIWLSWQFYKQSQTQNDRVQEAVGRVEQFVTEMHGNVKNIVQQAVTAWTSTAKPDEQEQFAINLVGSFDELRSKVEALEKDKDPDLRNHVLELVEENQQKTEELLSSLRESRIRSAFPEQPSTTGDAPNIFSAVRVIHKPHYPGTEAEEGEIILDVQRASSIITGTIHLINTDKATRADIDLLSSPEDAPDLKLNAGFGDGGLLNIHLHAPRGARITVGRYTLHYKVHLL